MAVNFRKLQDIALKDDKTCFSWLQHVGLVLKNPLCEICGKETYATYVQNNKAADNDWFRLESNKEGTRWFGKCWFIHNLLKYEFDIEFDVPVTYPATAVEIALPELDGKTAKMYRGGKICLSDHFKPLWARNVPKFGIAHAMALGLGPWLAVEIPDLIEKGIVTYKEKSTQ